MPPWLQLKLSALQLGYASPMAGSSHSLSALPGWDSKFPETRMESSCICLPAILWHWKPDCCSCPFPLSLQHRCGSMPATL